MSLSFYVAAKFEDTERVTKVIDTLVAMGHKISYRWADQKPTTDPDILKNQAALDRNGVFDCDVFVALFLDPLRYLNAYVELGMALAKNKVTCVIGDSHEHECIFTLLDPVHKFETEEEFYTFIKGL